MFERTCAFDGCQNRHRANGLCSSHLWQLDQGKELTPLRGRHGQKHERCTYPGCGRKRHSNGWCQSHQSQLDRGQPLHPIVPKQNRPFRHYTKQGYVLVRAPHGRPNAQHNGAILEHILVMTELLGRPLAKGETVHHRNNMKWDNRPRTWSCGTPTSRAGPAWRTRWRGPGGSSGATASCSRSASGTALGPGPVQG